MKTVLLALSLFAASFAGQSPEAWYYPMGNWPLCQAGINAGGPCPAFAPGTEPGMVMVRVPAASTAIQFAYAVECNGRRVTGIMPRSNFADGWSVQTIAIGCISANVTAIELP